VWCVVTDPKGALYAGTGNDGKVLKVEGGKGSLFFDAPELEVHALAFGPDGRLYVATSPDGKVYAVDGAAGTLRAVRITRRGVWCRWSAVMLKELAAQPHVRDFVALVGREMRGKPAADI